MEGEDGVEVENIDEDFFSEGSENEGDEVGLWEGVVRFGGDHGGGRGGKSTNEDREGGASILFCGGGEGGVCEWSNVICGGETTEAIGVCAARSEGGDWSCSNSR